MSEVDELKARIDSVISQRIVVGELLYRANEEVETMLSQIYAMQSLGYEVSSAIKDLRKVRANLQLSDWIAKQAAEDLYAWKSQL